MKIKIGERNYDLSVTKVMGIIPVSPDESVDPEAVIHKARSMYAAGAEFVEIGIESRDPVPAAVEAEKLLPVIAAVTQNTKLVAAVNTVYPEIMIKAADAGARLIISPDALRQPAALDTVRELDLPVCLMFDHDWDFTEARRGPDPIATVSEFLFERIDACLNAGISRKKLLIDPSLGPQVSAGVRLKLLGRLRTVQSFGVPVTVALPQSLPYSDTFLKNNFPITVTLALFSSHKGNLQILRTENVADMAIALGTWHLSLSKARPFKLSKAIIRRLGDMRDKFSERKKRRQE